MTASLDLADRLTVAARSESAQPGADERVRTTAVLDAAIRAIFMILILLALVILIAFGIFSTPYAARRLIRAHRAGSPSFVNVSLVRAVLPPQAHTLATNQDAPVWSALDERQLTRLLTDSAPRTDTE